MSVVAGERPLELGKTALRFLLGAHTQQHHDKSLRVLENDFLLVVWLENCKRLPKLLFLLRRRTASFGYASFDEGLVKIVKLFLRFEKLKTSEQLRELTLVYHLLR